MKSPHSTIPADHITHVGVGWIYTCDCGHTAKAPYRPGADMAAREHRPVHGGWR